MKFDAAIVQTTCQSPLGIITLADARGAAKRILAEKTLGKHQPGRVKGRGRCAAPRP